MIKEITNDIISGKKNQLEQIEIREIFDEIYQGISNSISSSAFIAAFEKTVKTEETLQAVIEASQDAIRKQNCTFDNLFQTINLSYNNNYLDVYFAVDIINAANNIKAVKAATPRTNNNSIFRKYSLKSQSYSNEFMSKFEENSFCYYYLGPDEKYLKYTNEIRNNVSFENIFDFVDYFLNPFSVKNCMVGVNNQENVQKMAQLALLLKYENTLIVSAPDAIPYAVLEGENTIAEAWKNKIFTYTLDSKLIDLPLFPIDDIKINNESDSIRIIKDVFENKTKNAAYYTIVLNSGLSLYISKNAPSLIDGIKLAQKTIESDLAIKKITQIENNL